jgi:DNA-binding response OmpR family regulator
MKEALGAAKLPDTARKRSRILLVEDDEWVRELFVDHLELAGFEVLTAANGIDGLTAYMAHKPDLVVTDYAMPRMSGIRMILRLIEITPGLPIIMVTGFAYSDPHIAVGVAAGVFSLLDKPVSAARLIAEIAELLKLEPCDG